MVEEFERDEELYQELLSKQSVRAEDELGHDFEDFDDEFDEEFEAEVDDEWHRPDEIQMDGIEAFIET